MPSLDVVRLTVLVPSGPPHDPNRMHLHIVLAGPCEASSGVDHVAWVSVQSVTEDAFHDPTCILDQGDHSFVSKPSWVNYRKSDLVEVDRVQRGIDSGCFIKKEPMNYDVFRRVLAGVYVSKHTPLKVKDFIDFASVE